MTLAMQQMHVSCSMQYVLLCAKEQRILHASPVDIGSMLLKECHRSVF